MSYSIPHLWRPFEMIEALLDSEPLDGIVEMTPMLMASLGTALYSKKSHTSPL